MLYFKMKRFLLYITLSSGSSYSTAYNSWNFYDKSQLFAVFEWSVNYLLDTCYFVSWSSFFFFDLLRLYLNKEQV